MKISNATGLSNSELITEVKRLAGGEREATVALIVHLAEFDARRLFEAAGFSSTFKYCMVVLHLSEDAAFNRIEAARAARKYPVVIDMLITGALSPTTARMLARHLTADNQTELLAAASGKSKQEVESLLARLFPQPDVPPSIRKLPSVRPALLITAPTITLAARPPSAGPDIQAPAALAASPPASRPVVRPLAAERYAIRFTASAETCEKLRLAQDLLGHAVPTGDLAQVFDRALTLLIEDLQRKKVAVTKRPRKSHGQSEDSRNIPAEVRRAVWIRDCGRCSFVSSSGQRCGERRFLEYHHVHPYGAGGQPTVGNIQLLCKSHNRYEAERFYGASRHARGGDVAREPIVGYEHIAETPPVPERVNTSIAPRSRRGVLSRAS